MFLRHLGSLHCYTLVIILFSVLINHIYRNTHTHTRVHVPAGMQPHVCRLGSCIPLIRMKGIIDGFYITVLLPKEEKKINVSNFILLYFQCFPLSLSEARQACVRCGAVSVFRSTHSMSDSLHGEKEQSGAVGKYICAGTPLLMHTYEGIQKRGRFQQTKLYIKKKVY